MFELKNGLYLDAYPDQDTSELNGEIVWHMDETSEEFWNHPKQPQFLFNCGPQTYEETISENFSINNALDAELPDYIWPSTKINRYIFYRLDAEKDCGKSLTFEEAIGIVAAHMERLGIKQEEL